MYECPFVKEWTLLKTLSTRKERSAETKTKQLLRDKYFEFCNERRQQSGKPRLEDAPNNEQIVELDDGFGYLYQQFTKGRTKSTMMKDLKTKLTTNNDTDFQHSEKKRLKKGEQKLEDQETCTLTDRLTDIPFDIVSVREHTLNDPQGYAMLFANFIKTPVCKLSKSTASKYLRSFRLVVKQCSQSGLDLQNGYEEFISHCTERKELSAATINNVIAAVAYFVKKIAKDDYAKSVSFDRLKQYDPEKQPIFPLKYYAKALFKAFMGLFGEEHDLNHIALFGYFAGLRIFEIMKLKKKDIRAMDKGKGLAIMVFGKGSKHRVTYIMDRHVVDYVNKWLRITHTKDSDYLFMSKFWGKNY